MDNNEIIQEIKIVFIGPSNSGKTSILSKFMKSQKEVVPTVGCSFLVYPLYVNNQKIHFNFWDTCGTERFKSVAPFYYRNTQAVIAVIDLTSQQSLSEARSWIQEMKSHERDIKFLALAANKVDDTENREISAEEIQSFKEDIGADFAIETSAFKDIGIQELFQAIVRNVLDVPQTDKIYFNASLTPSKESSSSSSSSSCCS